MKSCLECDATFSDKDGFTCSKCGFTPPTMEGFVSFAPALSVTNEHFPDAFVELFELEAGHFWFKARNRIIFWALKKYFPEAASYLEIGCGTGYVLNGVQNQFPKLKLCGSEIFHKGLHFARERLPGVTFFQLDACKMPFSDEFDVIAAFDVLEHIQNDEQVLQQVRKSVSAKTGGIIITVPQHQFLWSKQDEYACHVRRYSERELREKVEKAGFEVVFNTSFVTLLLPPMLAARTFRNVDKENFDPVAEFKISPLLNRLFEVIMNVELSLIKFGFSLPVGGSLLMVAKIPQQQGHRQNS